MYYRDYGERDLAREIFADCPTRSGAPCKNDYSEAERNCPQGLEIAKLMREASGC